MDHIKKLYKDSFKEFGDSPKSVLWPKGRQEERFRALTRNIDKKGNFSVLDFGCGLAHSKKFLELNFENVSYTGVDMVEEFISHNRTTHKNGKFFLPEEFKNDNGKYDYIISSGAFNILYAETVELHQRQIETIFRDLFDKTNEYLAIDFMTDQVDFMQAGAYHASPSGMLQFFLKNISRRTIVDHSYMPFEFCITAFKKTGIKKPDNIYEL